MAGIVAGVLLCALLWFIRHVITVTIPKVTSDLLAELKEARKQYHDQLTEERQMCERRHEDNKALQAKMIEALDRVMQAVAGLAADVKIHHAVVDQVAGIKRENGQAGPRS